MPHRARSAAALAVALVVALAETGCVSDQGTLQVVAPRPVQLDLREMDLQRASIRRDVRGTETRVTSVLLLPTGESPRLEQAVEDALLDHGGDVMVRARVRTLDFWFLIGITTLEVRGDVVDLLEVE